MVHTYSIQGMHCESCIAKITNSLKSIAAINDVQINLSTKMAVVDMDRHITEEELNTILQRTFNGKYLLGNEKMVKTAVLRESTFQKLMPLTIILSLIIFLTLTVQYFIDYWDLMQVMRNFMGLFFIVFGSFKLLNWKGFADSYQTYDVIAKQSNVYAYIYPILELFLGFGYLYNIYPVAINVITFIVMSVSTIGVAQALTKKEEIQCACLGVVFKIPMTKVTLLENMVMALMALYMLTIIM